jgi:hypothetical protein
MAARHVAAAAAERIALRKAGFIIMLLGKRRPAIGRRWREDLGSGG